MDNREEFQTRVDVPLREYDSRQKAPRRATAPVPKRSNLLNSSDSYAACYFRDNPEVQIDLSDPKTKLEEFEKELASSELDEATRFQILIREKSMIYLIYDENSPEAFRIHARLGAFYNETHRPQSALRHLKIAHDISTKNKSINPNELILVAVDSAESHLALRNDNKQESQKHISQANDCLKQIHEYQIDDLDLKYRCELVTARVTSAGKHPEKSFTLYEQAMNTLREINGDQIDKQTLAKLYVEMSEVAEKMNDDARKSEYAGNAYEIFIQLGMYGSANIVREKVSEEKIKECQEKYSLAESSEEPLLEPYSYENPINIELPPEDTENNM